MKLELKPDIIEDGSSALHQTADHAGFTKDGLYLWIYKDSVLEIIYSKTNESLAQWRFGKAVNDKNSIISCVTEFECSDGHILLVATESSCDEGTLSLFSLSKKKVVRAIEFPRKIRAVEVIFTNTKDDVPPWILSKHLNFFCGLAAVGTEGGYTYLVDLCLDDVMINSTTEIQPKKLSVSSPNLVDPKAKRNAVCSSDKHMAVLIDDQCHRNRQFYHRRQDDTIDKVFDEDTVYITSLKYLSQAGVLAIGFNFGCFQLWRLYSPVLDYSSRYMSDALAISHFVVQEPENDPRNLVYLWVGRDSSVMGEENSHGKVSNISLYQLCFNKKDCYAGFGLFYEDLESVCGRLDHNLLVNPYLGECNQTTWSSQLISAYTIVNPLYTPPVSVANDSFEEGFHGNDLSLCIFVWRADSKQSGHSTCYWMAIFDLNRWYHAQMPHSIRCIGNVPQVCAYWAVYKLDEIVALSFPHLLLHVQVTGNNVLRFINKSPLPPEEHSFPSALDITDIRFITPQRTVKGHCYGWQGQLLQELVKDGALHLVQPSNFYHLCLQARLIPQNYNESKANSVEHQRKVLLNLALEHNVIVRLIHNCIHLWGDGEYVDAGCNLTLLLEWAWNAVVRIKEKLDSSCQVLYDCSGHILDPYTDWLIRRQHCGLVSLKQVFTIFLSQTNPTTDRGQQELEMRLEVIRLLVQHHDMVRWCLVEGLVPEIKEGSTQVPGLFTYPYGELCRATRKRRAELKAMNGVVTDHSLLLVDSLVKCAGPQINSIWEADGEDGLYPPPSMQALMQLFFLEDVLLEVKQAIVLYLLQDLAAVLGCDDDHQTVVISFVRSFNLLPSLVHTVQGLWFIDHRDYEEGLRQLVNPNVLPHSWSAWVDVAVVNTLLAQCQNATAAHYIHSGHCLGATLDEQKLNIAVFIRNGKVSPAVNYMRQCCYHKHDPTDLMPFMMKECQGNKMIGQLLQLHLLHAEEVEVEKFLWDRSEPQALEPLLLYYLTHSRFVEAFTLNEEMNKMDKLEATSLAAREKAANRNRLMEAYLRVLPDITRKLLMEKRHRPAVVQGKKVEVTKPKPLSTVVNQKDQNVISRSCLIMAVMDKVEEAMNAVEETHLEEDGEPEDKHNVSVFAATPMTPRHKSFVSVASTPVAMSYPESHQASMPANALSAAKKELLERSVAGGESDRQSLSILTKECLDLLKTPLKESKSDVSPKPTTFDSAMKTPQSILKVRRLSRSLLPSARESRNTNKTPPDIGTRPKKLGFSASDSAILSPSFVGQDKSPTQELSLSKKMVATTPKHLRFVGISPSPSPSPSPLPVSARVLLPASDVNGSSFISDEDSQEMNNDSLERTDSQEQEAVEANETVDEERDAGAAVERSEEQLPEVEPNVKETDVKTVEYTVTKSVLAENVEMKDQNISIEEGPSDRYVDDLGNLVRPDLLSPWKQNNSSEELMAVDNESSLNLTHVEGVAITPAMTSSPVEETLTENKSLGDHVTRESTHILSHEEFKEENTTVIQSKIEDTTVTELHRNILMSLVAPNKSLMTSFTSTKTSDEGHTRTSERFNLDVDTSFTVERSLRSRGELSPEKRGSREPDSPPATPPLSKRARMIVKEKEVREEARKSRFDFTTPRLSLERELRSTRNTEKRSTKAPVKEGVDDKEGEGTTEEDKESMSVSESRPSTQKMLERKSLRSSVKGDADDEEVKEDEENKDVEETETGRRPGLRKTPERKSPARSLRKHDPVEEIEKEDKESENVEQMTEIKSRLRRTPERRSPARTMKRKTIDDEDDSGGGKEEILDQNTSISTRLRKTPERQSPARSTRRKAGTDSEDEKLVKKIPEESEHQTRARSAKRKLGETDDKNVDEKQSEGMSLRQRKTPERKSPSRSVKSKATDHETDDDTSHKDTLSRLQASPLRDTRSKTPDRKSPSRSVKKKATDHETDDDASHKDTARLQGSLSRDTRSKTPERKSTSRKSKILQINIVEEEVSVVKDTQLKSEKNIDRNEEEEHFSPAEEVIDNLNEETLAPLSPSRRRSSRLNTPERSLGATQQSEPARRQSRGRSTSVSIATGDAESTTKSVKPGKKDSEKEISNSNKEMSSPSGGRSKSPTQDDKSGKHHRFAVEDEHDLRRSRRLSRTPERFRSEVGESTTSSQKSKEKLITNADESKTPSPTRKSLRITKSPERLNTDQIETVILPVSPQREMPEAVEISQDLTKSSNDKLPESADGVWSEDLPALRLEEDEEVGTDDKVTKIKKPKNKKGQNESNSPEKEKTTIEFKDYSASFQSQSVSHLSKTNSDLRSSLAQASFVFSDPLTHADDSVGSAKEKGSNDVEVKDDHQFVFSRPTIAEDETAEEEPRTEKSKPNPKNVASKSKKKRKVLLGSPALLPISSDEERAQEKKERAKTRMSEIQRASANVVRRYSQRSRPMTRRLVPSSSLDQSEEGK